MSNTRPVNDKDQKTTLKALVLHTSFTGMGKSAMVCAIWAGDRQDETTIPAETDSKSIYVVQRLARYSNMIPVLIALTQVVT